MAIQGSIFAGAGPRVSPRGRRARYALSTFTYCDGLSFLRYFSRMKWTTSYFCRGTIQVCGTIIPNPRVSVWYIARGSEPFLNLPVANRSDVGSDPGWSCVPWQFAHTR